MKLDVINVLEAMWLPLQFDLLALFGMYVSGSMVGLVPFHFVSLVKFGSLACRGV